MKTTLIIMAAGMGSRYGGLKQIDPVGPAGEVLLDYSVYDAVAAGFTKVVFVIRRELEADFRASVGNRAERWIETAYAYQDIPNIPGRTKPWGTGDAILASEDEVEGPFAVINADDFYGTESFDVMAHFLRDTVEATSRYAMVGFLLRNTLSKHAAVARGICSRHADGSLAGIEEILDIETQDTELAGQALGGQRRVFSGDEPVSMNMWGFKPSIFDYLDRAFEAFLEENEQNTTAEFMLPPVVDGLIKSGTVAVDILETGSTWFGVTVPEDKADVKDRIARLIKGGVYPDDLGLQVPMFSDLAEDDSE